MDDSGEFVCSECLVPVTKVRKEKQFWTKTQSKERWVHRLGEGTPCGKQFLSEDEIEEAGDPGPSEVPVQD